MLGKLFLGVRMRQNTTEFTGSALALAVLKLVGEQIIERCIR